jgi:transcriptional regulator with XRE-family HTH domain
MNAGDKTIHQGRNIKRFREMLGIKQDALASQLGDDWNQKKVSLLEQKESVDNDLLQQVAAILKVPVEAIENFDEEKAINIISNTFSSHDNSTLNAINNNCSINPVDKWIAALEENKKLYERLLNAEREKSELLEKLLQGKA